MFLPVETKRKAVSVGDTRFRDPTFSPPAGNAPWPCQRRQKGVCNVRAAICWKLLWGQNCTAPLIGFSLQQIHFQKLSSPLKEAGSVSAKETALFGAGILWLFRLTHLRAFVSSPLARSWSSPPPAAFLFQYKMYLMWKHPGKDDGMGETKVNNVIWETPV